MDSQEHKQKEPLVTDQHVQIQTFGSGKKLNLKGQAAY